MVESSQEGQMGSSFRLLRHICVCKLLQRHTVKTAPEQSEAQHRPLPSETLSQKPPPPRGGPTSPRDSRQILQEGAYVVQQLLSVSSTFTCSLLLSSLMCVEILQLFDLCSRDSRQPDNLPTYPISRDQQD